MINYSNVGSDRSEDFSIARKEHKSCLWREITLREADAIYRSFENLLKDYVETVNAIVAELEEQKCK